MRREVWWTQLTMAQVELRCYQAEKQKRERAEMIAVACANRAIEILNKVLR